MGLCAIILLTSYKKSSKIKLLDASQTPNIIQMQWKLIYKKLKIPQLKDIHDIELSKFMFLHATNQLPPSLMLCFSLNENIHSHSTRHRNDPHIQARNTNIMTKNFLCKGPEIWLGIPNEINNAKLGHHSIIKLRSTSSHKME